MSNRITCRRNYETNTPFSTSGIITLEFLREAGIILMRKEGTKTFIILIYVQN